MKASEFQGIQSFNSAASQDNTLNTTSTAGSSVASLALGNSDYQNKTVQNTDLNTTSPQNANVQNPNQTSSISGIQNDDTASSTTGLRNIDTNSDENEGTPSTQNELPKNNPNTTEPVASISSDGGKGDDFIPDMPPYEDGSKKKEKKMILGIIGGVVILLFLVGGIGVYFADSIVPEHEKGENNSQNGENPYISDIPEEQPKDPENIEIIEGNKAGEDVAGDSDSGDSNEGENPLEDVIDDDEDFSGITPLPLDDENSVTESASENTVDEIGSGANNDLGDELEESSDTTDTNDNDGEAKGASVISDGEKGIDMLVYNLGWNYNPNDTIRLSARAKNSDLVEKVEFFADGKLIGTVDSYSIGGEDANWLDNPEDIYGVTESVGEWLEGKIDEKLEGHVYRDSKDWSNSNSECVTEEGFVHIFISENMIYDVRTSTDQEINEICTSGEGLNIEDLYYYMYNAPSENAIVKAIVYYDDGTTFESDDVEVKISSSE